MEPEVVRKAEQDVLEAATEWAREAPWQTRELTPAEQKLKIAVYLLGRTRKITGSFKLDIPK
jgi:hypothetical protein